MFLCVDGNIASGKSSFCKSLRDILVSKGYNVILYTEPLEKWRNVGGMNLLQLFYENSKRWAFTFQINALLNVADMEKNALIYSLNNYIVIMERCSFSIFEIFCKYLSENVFSSAESSIIEDFKSKYTSIINIYNKILYVYLKTDYSTCHKRLQERGRSEEIGSIDLSYLQTLQNLYDSSIEKIRVPLIFVDGTSYSKNSIESAKNPINNQNTMDEIFKYIQLYGIII